MGRDAPTSLGPKLLNAICVLMGWMLHGFLSSLLAFVSPSFQLRTVPSQGSRKVPTAPWRRAMTPCGRTSSEDSVKQPGGWPMGTGNSLGNLGWHSSIYTSCWIMNSGILTCAWIIIINVGCNFLYLVVDPCIYIYISTYYVPRALAIISEVTEGPTGGAVDGGTVGVLPCSPFKPSANKACNLKIHLLLTAKYHISPWFCLQPPVLWVESPLAVTLEANTGIEHVTLELIHHDLPVHE